MTPGEINETYINWKDYIFFRDTIQSFQTFTQNSNHIDSFIKHNAVPLDSKERHNFINICHEIRELFKIMSSYNPSNNGKCCNYINYYIRDQIKDLFPTKENGIFEYFKKYVDINKTDLSYKTCVSEIKYIEKEEFDKINELFNLYDHYETILNPDSEGNNDPNDCRELKEFIDEYNDIIQKHKDDQPFQKVLNNLRCSIENNELFNNNCKNELSEIIENEDNPWNKNECNESQEKEYLKKYSNPNYSYFGTTTYIQPVNMNVIIATTLSSVFLGTVLYYIYKFTASRNYLRNRFPRMRKMNRNISDETYQHEMCNRKHYLRDLKEKCYNVSYVSEKKY
ncbi:variable surface protein [Plasmodium gonderi]|uniref:Variable surface protein n=1 Tax=Plasmodium gonderi TaxID=77519 RepID=A0A1Y1JP77_PLAGO|nr:variable surface protein [Plasmodium gonderi]GAW84281.1 variable surface protein [Plasmodium gonderi]